MRGIWQDLRYGARGLWNKPGFTLIAVITLALGIGPNTVIFSVIKALILTSPHMAESERVVAIWRTAKEKRSEGYVSYLELQDWRAQNQSFEAIAAYKRNGFVTLKDEHAQRLDGMRVTANFLSLLKVKLFLGRDFRVEEENRGAENVVITSYQFWHSQLGASETALGKPLILNGEPFTVIGVLPPNFEFPLATKSTELLTTIAKEGQNLDERGAQVLRVLGRLKQDATFAQAQAELTSITANLEQQYPTYSSNTTAYIVPIDEQVVGSDIRRSLWILMGAVGFLLLIACANLSNLLLARARSRQRELALRSALGAGRWRIVRQWLTESLLLSLFAGGAGVLLATWGLSLIRYYGREQLPRIDEVEIDAPVLVFTLAVSVLTAPLFSLLPVMRVTRADTNEVLKAGAKNLTGSSSLRLWRDSIVVTEVAFGLVLLIGAGLMMRSFASLINVHPGFDPKNVLTGGISLTGVAYRDSEGRIRYIDETLNRLKALPGVEKAAFVGPMPFSGGNVVGDFRIEGHSPPAPGEEPYAAVRSVTSDYFQAIRIPLRKGRYFSEHDRRSGAGVAIINETLASNYFHNEDPIGKRIINVGANQNEGDPEQYEIVGVVGDVRHNSLSKAATPELYLAYPQNSWTWGNFLVRTTNDPRSISRSFSEAINLGDKNVPATNVKLLTEAISDTVSQARFFTLLFVLFGVTGLLLVLTGIYSVISFSVSHQTQEIGIRTALGAQSSHVLKLFVGKAVILTLIGIGLGLLASIALTRVMQVLLFGISATDWVTFIGMATLLVLVGLLASFIPARRATKVDPLVALRYE